MIRLSITAALALTLASLTPAVAADEKVKTAALPDIAAETAIRNLDLAERLLQYAEESRNANAALLAANILLQSPGGPAGAAESEGDSAMFAQTSADDIKKLGADDAKNAARPRIDLALDLATKLGKGDAAIKAGVDKARAMQVQLYPVTCWAYNSLGASFYWTAYSLPVAQANVIGICRANTPWGQVCYLSHCG